MIFFALVLMVVVLVGSIALYRLSRRLQVERERAVRAEQELGVVASLVGSVARAEWRRSAHELVQALVRLSVVRGAVLLSGAEAGAMEVLATASAQGEPSWERVSEASVSTVLRSGEPLQVDGDRYIPVMADTGTVGVLAVRGAAEQLHATLEVASRMAGLVLVGTKLYQKQAAISNTDGLTGLINHRYFQQVLGVSLGQAYLESAPLSIIFLDIDHFKQVNDTYGHQFGDLVLREIGSLLRRELPADAIPARYGGEEMIVLLQGEAARHGEQIAEQIRQAVAAHKILDPVSGTQIGVTISLGVANYELGQGKSRLIARADEALYNSKRSGRNRVTVAPVENVTLSPPVS
ncbi:MAG: diguanylate cyclase [Bacillota bacterium]